MLPSRLAFIVDGPGGRAGYLELAKGAGTDPIVVAPWSPRVLSFTWSSDGEHLAVLDSRRALHLLPEGVLARRPDLERGLLT